MKLVCIWIFILTSPLVLANPDKVVSFAQAQLARHPFSAVERANRTKPAFIWDLLDRLDPHSPSDFQQALEDYEALLRLDSPASLPKISASRGLGIPPAHLKNAFAFQIATHASQRQIPFAEFQQILRDTDLAMRLMQFLERRWNEADNVDTEKVLAVLTLVRPTEGALRRSLTRAITYRSLGVYSAKDLPPTISETLELCFRRKSFQERAISAQDRHLRTKEPLAKGWIFQELLPSVLSQLESAPTTIQEYDQLSQILTLWWMSSGPSEPDLLKQWMRLLALPVPAKDASLALVLACRHMKSVIIRLLLETTPTIMNFLDILRSENKIWNDIYVNSVFQRAEILGTYMQQNPELSGFCINILRWTSSSAAKRILCWRALDAMRTDEPFEAIRLVLEELPLALAEFMALAPDTFSRYQEASIPKGLRVDLAFASDRGVEVAFLLNQIREKALNRRPRREHTGPTDLQDHFFVTNLIDSLQTPSSLSDYATLAQLFRTAGTLKIWDPQLQTMALLLLSSRGPSHLHAFHDSVVLEAVEYLISSLERAPLPSTTWDHFLNLQAPHLRARIQVIGSLALEDTELQYRLFEKIQIPRYTEAVVSALEAADIRDEALQKKILAWNASHAEALPYLQYVGAQFVRGNFGPAGVIRPALKDPCSVHLLPFRPR